MKAKQVGGMNKFFPAIIRTFAFFLLVLFALYRACAVGKLLQIISEE
jgi:hypothetical protein